MGAQDKGYVLTAISHRATDQSQLGEPVTFTFTVNVDPSTAKHTPGALLFHFESDPVAQGGVPKGDWIRCDLRVSRVSWPAHSRDGDPDHRA